MDDLIHEIDAFCRRNNLKATTVSNKALNNTFFYRDYKRGTEKRETQAKRIRKWMADYEQEKQNKIKGSTP